MVISIGISTQKPNNLYQRVGKQNSHACAVLFLARALNEVVTAETGFDDSELLRLVGCILRAYSWAMVPVSTMRSIQIDNVMWIRRNVHKTGEAFGEVYLVVLKSRVHSALQIWGTCAAGLG